MGCITTHTTRIGGIRTETRRLEGGLNPVVSREGGTLRILASLICTVNNRKGYVRIEPEYIWLTESNLYSAIVNVESNVSWKAE